MKMGRRGLIRIGRNGHAGLVLQVRTERSELSNHLCMGAKSCSRGGRKLTAGGKVNSWLESGSGSNMPSFPKITEVKVRTFKLTYFLVKIFKFNISFYYKNKIKYNHNPSTKKRLNSFLAVISSD